MNTHPLVDMNRLILALALFVFAASIVSAAMKDSGEVNLYVCQAKSFLEGRVDIQSSLRDVAFYRDHLFSPFPPFPAVLLVPFVALFGTVYTKVTLVSALLSILNLFIFRRIMRHLDIEGNRAEWMAAAFFLGTAYWLSVLWSSGVWFFAHVVAVTCLLLAIDEALGKGRGYLVGLYLGLAFLSRALTLYGAVFLVAVLWTRSRDERKRARMGNIFEFLVMLGICVAVYMTFNWIRFGDPFDTGYSHIVLQDLLKERVERHGLFHWAYVPFNFFYMFLQGFHLSFDPPAYLSGYSPDRFGTSITFASPFVLYAILARWKRPVLVGAWISIGLAILHMLFYHNNGFVQINCQRFSLDFFPILMLLVALGTRRVGDRWWKAVIVYSILLNVLALVVLPRIAG
jgi:4-amino-4-deoxy-L-arabinose transferase-like glycosyltransferase